MEIAIRERIDLGLDETPQEAEAWLADPANKVMCEDCGWTWGMICPECTPGCGCGTGRCSGWRHSEYDDPNDDEEEEHGCPECGGGYDTYEECVCYQG
jgi:hypothetical protein